MARWKKVYESEGGGKTDPQEQEWSDPKRSLKLSLRKRPTLGFSHWLRIGLRRQNESTPKERKVCWGGQKGQQQTQADAPEAVGPKVKMINGEGETAGEKKARVTGVTKKNSNLGCHRCSDILLGWAYKP